MGEGVRKDQERLRLRLERIRVQSRERGFSLESQWTSHLVVNSQMYCG
jgi:hypothetical protein